MLERGGGGGGAANDVGVGARFGLWGGGRGEQCRGRERFKGAGGGGGRRDSYKEQKTRFSKQADEGKKAALTAITWVGGGNNVGAGVGIGGEIRRVGCRRVSTK